jgi:hypothetical protein
MRKVSVFKFKAQWLQKLINYNYNYKKLKGTSKILWPNTHCTVH